ncbi:MAG: FAD-dependent oxidoreductase [Planctomycetota bacterium]|nr:MAG: FAD-dependent oxidoreductase [Planctomycetota bacterium]
MCARFHHLLFFVFFLVIPTSTALGDESTTLWLECETFENLGGWTNDAQFVDHMGSPYLLAIGLDGPVADAWTTIDIPRDGTYRLWVRSRDWLPEYSPGRFQVILGEHTCPRTFGESKRYGGWYWEDGGTVTLSAGPLRIALHDLTGHYGRCDVVVLTSDLGYRPPNDLPGLAEARERFGGVSRERVSPGPYDTVVVGGGLAGTFAAVASARMGCKTALIQNRPVLGGNGSTEILVRPEGDTTREPLDPGEGGIIEEVRGDVFDYSSRMLALVQREPNLDLYLNTHATGVKMRDARRIEGVYALDVTTNRRYLFRGTMFIDCTGDGEIGVWAGAEYRHGQEPRSMYGESRAPIHGMINTGTMGGTLRYDVERLPIEVPFESPAWAHKFDDCDDFGPKRHPQLNFGGWQWVIEYGGQRDTYRDAEEIRDELLRIIWGMWDHAKNHCPRLAEDGAAYYRLKWVSHVVGKRESRRLIGDYVMREQDIGEQTLFPDRVAYGGWGIDIHPPGGFYAPGEPAVFSHKVKFSIPFRSLYSKDIDNLMMAGRCISVSHVALGATRVMITCGLQGQAVGTAAGLCKRHDTTPRGIYQNYIRDLQQQLLKDGCYLIKLPNEDPHDLALRAVDVTASSFAPPDAVKIPTKPYEHPLGHDRAVRFRLDRPRLEAVDVHLRNASDRPVSLKAGLHVSTDDERPAATPIATAEAIVPPSSKGWVRFSFSIDKPLPPGSYWFVLPKTEHVFWTLYRAEPAFTGRAYHSGKEWVIATGCYAFRTTPGEPPKAVLAAPFIPRSDDLFAPHNVVNGFARAIEGVPNSWRPDPKAPYPQWIEIDLGRSTEFNTVHVSFQSASMRADDFDIAVLDGKDRRPVAEIRDNTMRRRVVTFDTVRATRVRVIVHKAQPDMGICEIRIYNEP